MRRTWISAAATIVIGTVGAGFALAAGVESRVTTRLDASASGDSIAGKVRSAEKACVNRRKVKVIYRDARHAPQRLGTDEADSKGKYSVALDRFAPPGTYTALVKKATVDGTKCLPGFGVYEHPRGRRHG